MCMAWWLSNPIKFQDAARKQASACGVPQV